MNYTDQIIEMQGIVVKVKSGSVAIDFKGRLGHLTVPKRMVISDGEIKVGQEVGLKMSFIEVLSPEPNESYVSNIKKRKEKEEE